MHINSGQDLSSTVVSRQDLMQSEMARGMHTYIENHFDNSAVNGSLKVIPGVQATSDNSGVSQFVSPSTQSVAPSRYNIWKYVKKITWSASYIHFCYLVC